MAHPSISTAEPLIIGHRGASQDAPENTLAAFRLAWEQGADAIEGDFRLTADGKIVCIHDADLRRVGGVPQVVAETKLDALRAADVGAWKGERWRGERIPAIDEVLALVPPGKRLFVELKTGPEIVEPLAQAIDLSKVDDDRLLLMAFDAETVAGCKRRLPAIRCHLLVKYEQDDEDAWKPTAAEVAATVFGTGADGVGSKANLQVFDEAFVRDLHAAGVGEFHVWTVDDVEVARFYRQLGAWGLTTNRPGKLREELAL